MLFGDSEVAIVFMTELFKILIKLCVGALFAEGLKLHLFKLDCSESEVAGCDFVSERLAYLTDAERKLCAHCALNILIVDVFALSVFGTKIYNAFRVVCNAPVGLEHKVKFAYIRKIMFDAMGAGN